MKSSKEASKNGLTKLKNQTDSNSTKTSKIVTKNEKIIESNKLKAFVDESDNSAKYSTTTKSDTATQPSPLVETNSKQKFSSVVSKCPPQNSQVRTILEPESRKMQAERPALLQDLGKSKLLLKYKQSIAEPLAKIDQQQLAKIVEQNNSKTATTTSMTSEKSNNSLKLTSNIKTDDLSGVYTGGVNEPIKSVMKTSTTESTIYGADLVNLKANETMPKLNSEENSTEQVIVISNASNQVKTPEQSTLTTTNETKVEHNISNDVTVETPTKMSKITLVKESSIVSNEPEIELIHTKLEIVEEANDKQMLTANQNQLICKEENVSNDLETSSFIQSIEEHISSPNQHQIPRRSTFNPLHVILKDKNKYYTTEYI